MDFEKGTEKWLRLINGILMAILKKRKKNSYGNCNSNGIWATQKTTNFEIIIFFMILSYQLFCP
jgi:hypothetical protein